MAGAVIRPGLTRRGMSIIITTTTLLIRVVTNMRKPLKQKRDEAVERQSRRDKRSPQEQLLLLTLRPGEAKRERNRLLLEGK